MIIIGLVLVAGAEVAATIGPTAATPPSVRHATTAAARASPRPYSGEPRIPANANAPPQVRAAAVRFVRDYTLWSKRRLARIPANDATQRVIRLLNRQPRATSASDAAGSIRIRAAGHDHYIATSDIGNFLVGKQSRWLVISLPGD